MYPITFFMLGLGAGAAGYQWLTLWRLVTDMHAAIEGPRHDRHH